jgi:serine O-acetyltransferase
MIKADLKRTADLIKGSKSKKIIGCYRSPGCHAMVILRFGQWLQKKNIVVRIMLEPIYMLLYHRIRSKWGIEIPRVTQIGAGFYIGHSGGIIISGLAKIGENVNISQQVTIGIAGKGEKRGVPTIGDNVYIAPGAKIFGKITIGNNVSIGANAVVYKDIPNDSVVVLDPGFRILPDK